MIQSPEVQSRVTLLRSKILDGTATLEEMREGIKLLRQDRHAAQDAAIKGKKRTSAPKRPAASMDDMMKALGMGPKNEGNPPK